MPLRILLSFLWPLQAQSNRKRFALGGLKGFLVSVCISAVVFTLISKYLLS
jgi:hypothetical protein